MTAQINDRFRYRNGNYSLAGISKGELFDISVFDLSPTMASTACWRGYRAVFAISQSRLVLDSLSVNLIREDKQYFPGGHRAKRRLNLPVIRGGDDYQRYRSEQGPVINGIMPSFSRAPDGVASTKEFLAKFHLFNNHYEGLNCHLEYSGGVLLAQGFIWTLYVHMGFHPAWKYENVIELIFESGILKDEYDRSNEMAEIREMIVDSRK